MSGREHEVAVRSLHLTEYEFLIPRGREIDIQLCVDSPRIETSNQSRVLTRALATRAPATSVAQERRAPREPGAERDEADEVAGLDLPELDRLVHADRDRGGGRV